MSDISAQSQSATVKTKTRTSKPRLFWVGMVLFLIVMVVLGFGSTYGRQLVLGQEISAHVALETDWVIHLHAAVFVGWMLFLLSQTILASRGRIQTHMTLGGYGGIVLGLAIVVVGTLVTFASAQDAVSKGIITPAEAPFGYAPLILVDSWYGLLSFVLLVGLGLFYRRSAEAHKRYMIFGTIMIVFAATSRMDYLLGSWANLIGMGLMVAPLLAYDLYSDGSLHTATLVGTSVAALHLAV